MSCSLPVYQPHGSQTRYSVPKTTDHSESHSVRKTLTKQYNHLIFRSPWQEDIKAKLHGATVFSKMDLRSAFWQLELHPDSRPLTVFHCNNRLYRYKRLTMGVKPAQGELNTALSSFFYHIPQAHVIHDDLILAAKDLNEHNTCLKQVMEAF